MSGIGALLMMENHQNRLEDLQRCDRTTVVLFVENKNHCVEAVEGSPGKMAAVVNRGASILSTQKPGDVIIISYTLSVSTTWIFPEPIDLD